jgi:PDZ domain
MKDIVAFAFFVMVHSGCAAKMVERNANNSCAAQGKKAFIYNAKQVGIPLLVESASAMVLCAGPDDVVHLPAAFGADGISAAILNGVGILSVTPGLVADKAGLKPNDIVYDFGGYIVIRAAELRSAIDPMTAGGQAVIKFRRNGQEMQVTAHF